MIYTPNLALDSTGVTPVITAWNFGAFSADL